MSSISNTDLLFPNVLLIKEEIKICKGCMQERLDLGLVVDKEKLGITDWWFSSYKWGGKDVSTYTVTHIDNHPDCYNYEVQAVQKIIYDYLKNDPNLGNEISSN